MLIQYIYLYRLGPLLCRNEQLVRTAPGMCIMVSRSSDKTKMFPRNTEKFRSTPRLAPITARHSKPLLSFFHESKNLIFWFVDVRIAVRGIARIHVASRVCAYKIHKESMWKAASEAFGNDCVLAFAVQQKLLNWRRLTTD